MGQVILLTQQKGGAGKTTLLTSLAAFMAGRGQRVRLLDLDPQRSALDWSLARPAALPKIEAIESAEWRARSDIQDAAKGADWTFVDAPGSADSLGRSAMRAADFALVPCQPSAADVWATRATLHHLGEIGIPHGVVMNRVPPRGRVAEAAIAEAATLGAPVIDVRIGARSAFAEAFMTGRGVSELRRAGRAVEEIAALADALAAQVGATAPA
ncbi:MAG: ParA family partition ATPase [Pseudomonadota bacterium]